MALEKKKKSAQTLSYYYNALIKANNDYRKIEENIDKLTSLIDVNNPDQKVMDKLTSEKMKRFNLSDGIQKTKIHMQERIKTIQQMGDKASKEDKQELQEYQEVVIKAEQSKLDKYEKERDNLLQSVLDISKTEKSVVIIQKILESPDKKPGSHEKTLSIANGLQGAIKLGLGNAPSLVNVLTSSPYYLSESKKLKEGRDAKDPSFFLKLLNDPKSKEELDKILPNLSSVANKITPDIVAASYRLLSQNKSINEKIDKYQANRVKLAKKYGPESGKVQKIDKELKNLQLRKNISEVVLSLEKNGYDIEYIKTNLSVVSQSLIEKSFTSSDNWLKLVNNIVDIALAEDKKESVNTIIDLASSDLIKNVLENEEVRSTLSKEKEFVAKLTTLIISKSELLDNRFKELGISTEVTENIVKLGAEGASTLLPFASDVFKLFAAEKENIKEISSQGYNIVSQLIDRQKELPEGKSLPVQDIVKEILPL
ncbi:MAG: hypothetical protein DGJ47_001185, partial [Rickettsiaceae bacterium]